MSIDNKQNAELINPESTYIMTDHDRMCIEANRMPRLYNILASFFTWILLAGFIVFPGTFTKLRSHVSSTTETGTAGQIAQAAVNNIPLIYIAAFCCVVGALGMCWLWWIWSRNYEWLLNHIFM
jgi:hypothetical protein